MGRVRIVALAAAAAVASELPTFPTEYEAVMLMKMPYIGLEMPVRVVTSASSQKIEYYDGLEIDASNSNGTHKFTFKNGQRTCLFHPSTTGPTFGARADVKAQLSAEPWKALNFFPDLSTYTAAGEELVGGVMCQKYTLAVKHGSKGTMDDHISFYWDPVLGKPVRWHMHSRHVVFNSHTDEYSFEYLSVQAGRPADTAMALPGLCRTSPERADVSVRAASLLSAVHAGRFPLGEEAAPALFDAFLAKYAKSYSPSEHSLRRKVFEKNVQLVQDLNRQHAGKTRFRGNRFLDMTREEILSLHGGKRKGSSRARRTPEHRDFVREHVSTSEVPTPKDFDWRSSRPGVVGPVKDQGMCGSCWAYGLMEPIESARAVQSGEALVALPEQFAVDCTWTNGTGSSGGNFGCDGGDSDIGALEIVRKFGGIVPTAAAYGSYLSVNGFCKDIRLMEVGAKLTGWSDVKARDEHAVLDALVSKGPLSIGIQVPDEMVFYDSGVLNVESCRHDESQIDHAVVLTGFGTDEHGVDFYTIRNSWSTYWGDEGYVKVARGERDCSISSEAGYPLLAKDASEIHV